MTNGEYYAGSFYAAFKAHSLWCERCIEEGSPWCRTEGACDVCPFRWLSLPYDEKEGARFVSYAGESGLLPLPTNKRAEREFLKACGVSSGDGAKGINEREAGKHPTSRKRRPVKSSKSPS